ncbi:MAG TPA: PIN domain-containing protein [Blastocatellia bacterium]|nr:PIN domain-containing protein [Blastocatellia bacterium]
MRLDVALIRIVFVAALVGAGYKLKPINDWQWRSALIGGILAVSIIFFETRIRKASLRTLIGGAVGSLIGIAGATLIAWIISAQETEPIKTELIKAEFKTFLTVTITLFMGYVGLMVGAVKGDYLDLTALGGIFVEKGASKSHPLILDTSVIIDGRVADIAETGFLAGTLVIPQFVLRELQQIADSADSIKRNRGRRGLDILQRLQKKKGSYEIVISEADFPDVREVDHKLIELARQLEGKIVTNDFNLNKVAQLRGVSVLNINELANALKPVVLPGEIMRVFVLKEGKEYNQGVAYLDDGTMVVVDNARRMIGKNVDVSVTSVLQTTAGKMIFGRYTEDGRAASGPRHNSAP